MDSDGDGSTGLVLSVPREGALDTAARNLGRLALLYLTSFAPCIDLLFVYSC